MVSDHRHQDGRHGAANRLSHAGYGKYVPRAPEEKAMMQQMMGGTGMNANGMTTTIAQCITNDNPVPETQENCRQTHTQSGNTVNFETVCADSTSTGQVTYDGNSMRGTVNSHATVAGRETNSTIEITGQYIGPC